MIRVNGRLKRSTSSDGSSKQPQGDNAAVVLGLRERGKRDRLNRLRLSAAEVIRRHGYDAATVRDIAQLADVSVGTLFVYAKDKRDLLFLVLNDELDEILQVALAAAHEPAPLLDQLVTLLGPIYEFFAREPEFARPVLREVVHYDRPGGPATGEQVLRYVRRLAIWESALGSLLREAEHTGEVRVGDSADALARVLFDVHLAEVRRWMGGDQPIAAEGKAKLTALFGVVLEGRRQLGC